MKRFLMLAAVVGGLGLFGLSVGSGQAEAGHGQKQRYRGYYDDHRGDRGHDGHLGHLGHLGHIGHLGHLGHIGHLGHEVHQYGHFHGGRGGGFGGYRDSSPRFYSGTPSFGPEYGSAFGAPYSRYGYDGYDYGCGW